MPFSTPQRQVWGTLCAFGLLSAAVIVALYFGLASGTQASAAKSDAAAGTAACQYQIASRAQSLYFRHRVHEFIVGESARLAEQSTVFAALAALATPPAQKNNPATRLVATIGLSDAAFAARWKALAGTLKDPPPPGCGNR